MIKMEGSRKVRTEQKHSFRVRNEEERSRPRIAAVGGIVEIFKSSQWKGRDGQVNMGKTGG